MWGTTGLGYNLKKVRERLGAEAVVDSWSILFDPAKVSKLASCGVHVLDATEELFPAALRYLGLNPDTKAEGDLRKAADLLGQDQAAYPEIPLLRIHHRAREWRYPPRRGLFGVTFFSEEARGRSQEWRRNRLCHPEGRCADVVRQLRDPLRCRETRKPPTS